MAFVVWGCSDPRASDPVRSKADLLAQCEGGLQLFSTIALLPKRAYPSGDGAAVEWGCYSVAQGRGQVCRLNFTGVDVFLTTDDGMKITGVPALSVTRCEAPLSLRLLLGEQSLHVAVAVSNASIHASARACMHEKGIEVLVQR